MPGIFGIFSGCFAESVPKSSFRDLGTKSEPKRAKRDRKQFKMEPKSSRPKWNQKGTKRVPTDAKVAPKSCLGAFEVFFSIKFFLQNGKNGNGALVGLTLVKGISVDTFF